MLRCPNGLCHVVLDVLAALWRENDTFGFFGVWHANRGQIKYDINSYNIEHDTIHILTIMIEVFICGSKVRAVGL